MTATAIQPMPTEDVKQPITAATPIQQVTTEEVKLAILALIRENNAEFKAFLSSILPKKENKPVSKKEIKNTSKPITIVQGERIPYSEMPFWKANPHLKPVDLKAQGYGVSVEAFKNLQALFQEPGNEITDEWFEID